ncbi:virulence RhuM family protein [Actinobacillus porcinus]|uniref:virulence RhuM family protein n=1 Tax=Actinobacillus porcinus TaxID=51048 RepID=UPI002355290C|nr:RhuM family protein [Actinobacillus porcinus]
MQNQIQLYTSADGKISLQVSLDNETVWLSLDQMATLFDRDKSVISRHIRNLFNEGELEQNLTVAKNATVQMEGEREVRREIDYYNLDVIISVGYRVKSMRGVQFRQWATQTLKQFLVQGYVLNQKRLRGKGVEAIR